MWRSLMAGVGLLARQPAEALTLENNNKDRHVKIALPVLRP